MAMLELRIDDKAFLNLIRKWLKAGILDKGQVYLCRYADDFVCAFEYEKDAQRFYKALKLRLNKFGLEVAEDKTNIMVFSRRKLNRKTRIPIIKRRTSREKMRASLATTKIGLSEIVDYQRKSSLIALIDCAWIL
ncbi:MAG: reverse transcriptase domain-containing protein [Methylococcales bacterium]|nr:reverse transcriptase domain-containing protein [Methylococcales bacterium]